MSKTAMQILEDAVTEFRYHRINWMTKAWFAKTQNSRRVSWCVEGARIANRNLVRVLRDMREMERGA